ncbi:MAG TPA: Wadjet anti-phage system protein JetD domain-containing protein [Herpetosiphonaceae bacterium]
MSPELEPVARALLHTLLDRFEQPERRTVVRVRLSAKEHPRYFATDDSTPRRETNVALEALARDGVLTLHWARWERGNWLEAVDLVPEHAALLYARLKRTPRDAQAETLESLLAFETAHAEWHASFLAWAHDNLARHRSVTPLALDDPRKNRDLLRALSAIARLTQPTLERTLSVRLFNDSKRLEALRPAIVNVLRHHTPDAASYGDDTRALLAAHYLDRVPEYVPVAGPLTLQHRAQPIDLAPFVPSIALSAAMLSAAAVLSCKATAIVTVENATSFSELAALRPDHVLALYSGGFATPTLIALLRQIRAAAPDVPCYHWGDCDAGGLRILAHLRARLGPVAPLMMDAATFEAYQAHAQPLTAQDRATLTILRANPGLDDCSALIDRLLMTDRKLEQEAVSAAAALEHLSTRLRISAVSF